MCGAGACREGWTAPVAGAQPVPQKSALHPPPPPAAEDELRASGVPFAIVRPVALTEEAGGMPLVVDQGDTLKGKVSREVGTCCRCCRCCCGAGVLAALGLLPWRCPGLPTRVPAGYGVEEAWDAEQGVQPATRV